MCDIRRVRKAAIFAALPLNRVAEALLQAPMFPARTRAPISSSGSSSDGEIVSGGSLCHHTA
jgi:hypothetical protein